MLQVHPLAQDRDQDVDAHGDPDLGLHRVLGSAEERLDVEMLLHPFEEQLDLPSRLVEGGDDMRRQHEVVGDEYQSLLGLHIAESDASQAFRVGRGRLHAVDHDDPVRSHAGGLVNRLGLNPSQLQRRLGACNKERARRMEPVKSFQVLIATVHDVVGTGLWREHVQRIHIVDFPVGYVDESRDGTTQIDQGMQLHSRLGPAELGPRKQFQAEVDGRRVQRVDRLSQVDDGGNLGVQLPCFGDQYLGKVREDPPVPAFIGIRERCAANGTTNPQVVQLRRHGSQARLNIPKAFAGGQLGKGHAQELIEAGETATWTPLGVSGYTASEVRQWEQVHDLREYQPTDMHVSPCQGAGLAPEGHSKSKSIQPSMLYLLGEYRVSDDVLNFLTGQQ